MHAAFSNTVTEVLPPLQPLSDDTPLTVGLFRELLQAASLEIFTTGQSGFRLDRALLNAIDDRIPNPWAGTPAREEQQ